MLRIGMLEELDLEGDLQVIRDLHWRPHYQVLNAVFCLCLTNHIKQPLIV
jgi:hypothetical protein